MKKKDIDQVISAGVRDSAKRARRRMAPTFGAVILFALLAIWVGYNAIDSARDIDRTAAQARVDACERGNIIRKSYRESNKVLLEILNAAISSNPEELMDARRGLIRYLESNPNDPIASFLVIGTQANPVSRKAVEQARVVLKQQTRAMAPVDCSKVGSDQEG